jgi:CheY-like chemotaxis protein
MRPWWSTARRKRSRAPASSAPTCSLLDIGLPEMDGKELARRLKAQPETAHAILVAVTGYGREHDRDASLEAGFSHHLVKPVDPQALNAVLADASARLQGPQPVSGAQ